MQAIMASLRSVFTFLVAVFLFISPSHSVGKDSVNMSLYYDTLCLSCAKFIVEDLARVFDQDLISILNLRMIPWGNAYINKSTSAALCQNGEDECMLNTVEACSIEVWRDVNKHFALIYCIEFLAIEGRHKEWSTCFNTLGLPPEPILDCYKSGNGTKLTQRYADEIVGLYPTLTFLPWVLVNDQPIQRDYEKFVAYICKAYQGNAVPQACRSQPPTESNSSSMLNTSSWVEN